ncbi:MAG TPA: hypothetical protein VFR18_02335 [Terriglobia bacterium]|nr:hypothetical protein [Terriglobia bacterium]
MRMTNRFCSFALWLVLATVPSGRMAAFAQSSQAQSDSYEWSAELVAFDEATRMLTVKAMAAGDALKHAAALKTGEKVLLTWSVFEKHANAVNGVHKYDATRKPESGHAFPAEFVGYDTNVGRITFKAPIPADSVSRTKALKPGQWVTATSRPGTHAETQAITAVRGYNDLETAGAK